MSLIVYSLASLPEVGSHGHARQLCFIGRNAERRQKETSTGKPVTARDKHMLI